MENRYWQRRSQARFAIIVYSIMALLPTPFMIAYKFNKPTIIIQALMLAIAIIFFLISAAKGTLNRVFISKEGFAIKRFFKKQFYSWGDVDYCKEVILQAGPTVEISYNLFLKRITPETPKCITIEKYKNADGEPEKYIEVEPLRKNDSESKKSRMHIQSWRKRSSGFALNILTFDAVIIFLILYSSIKSGDFLSLKERIMPLAIMLAIEITLVLLLIFVLRKKRVEMDATQIYVYYYKSRYNIDWRDVTGISVTKRKTGKDFVDFYKIYVEDKKEYPFRVIELVKDKKLERDIKKYYPKYKNEQQ